MRAVRFDGRQTVLDGNYPDPKPGESVVRVDLAGLCGTDLEILDGYMGYKGVLGHEFVGTVLKSENPEMIGKRVVGEINAGCGACDYCARGMERHCPGRTVLGILGRDGAFAELLSLPERNLHQIPDSISDEQAVFVEPLAAAFEITEQVSLKPEWSVAVVGDGRLAHLVSQVLRLSCPNVSCFGRHKNKLARMERFGIATKIGIAFSDEQRFDLVVESSGRNSGFDDAARLVRPRGIIVLKSTVASRGGQDLTAAVINEVTLVGSRCGLFMPAIKALASGIISVEPLFDCTFPLEGFPEAVARAKRPDTMKVFLKPHSGKRSFPR